MIRNRKKLVGAVATVAAAAIALAGCSSSGSSPSANKSSSNTTKGSFGPGKATDTATWAEAPAALPNYIFPFAGFAYFTVANLSQFQELMYRPLYWFGDSAGKPNLNTSLSLADSPVFSNGGKTATVTLKSYKWSNGETLTSQDVKFWVNMEIAEKANWADYVQGQFPDNLTSITTPNATTVVFNFNKAYSQQWITYNQLSQITPFPLAWDKTSATASGTCATSVSGCKAVYTYLAAQAKQTTTYASSPLWSVVDGPWKLKSYNSDGNVSFVPNTSYSGPVKPTLKQFNEVPYTTDSAEYNVLKAGSTLDVGYATSSALTSPKPDDGNINSVGANPVSPDYNLVPVYGYGINYFPFNFTNKQVGPIFKQLYFRQAFQSVVDQEGIIKAVSKGYGVPTTGPIPTAFGGDLVPSIEKGQGAYPFSITNAAKYLSSNGWTVKNGGTTTCTKPGTGSGECGAGISKGEGLSFTLPYASGSSNLDTAMADLKSNAAQVGIKLNLQSQPFDTVIGEAVRTSTKWEMANWGGGWIYAPDYYPTGESIFSTTAGSNTGTYSDSTIDNLINETTTQSGSSVVQNYATALTKQNPVVWQPNYASSLTEIANGLSGVTPQNPFLNLTPENWRW